MGNQSQTGTASGYGTQPNVSNLVGQASGFRNNMNQALNGSGAGQPDITSLVGNVNTMMNSRNAAMNVPTTPNPMSRSDTWSLLANGIGSAMGNAGSMTGKQK